VGRDGLCGLRSVVCSTSRVWSMGRYGGTRTGGRVAFLTGYDVSTCRGGQEARPGRRERNGGAHIQGSLHKVVRSRTPPVGPPSRRPSRNQRAQPRGRRCSLRTPWILRRFFALIVGTFTRRREGRCETRSLNRSKPRTTPGIVCQPTGNRGENLQKTRGNSAVFVFMMRPRAASRIGNPRGPGGRFCNDDLHEPPKKRAPLMCRGDRGEGDAPAAVVDIPAAVPDNRPAGAGAGEAESLGTEPS